MASRCKDLCLHEISLWGPPITKIILNKKCRTCEIRLNTDALRCYCCNYQLSPIKYKRKELKELQYINMVTD